MIAILHTENTKFRTFGWVQNPSDFRKLCNVVAVFDQNSPKHKEIKSILIPSLVSLENGRKDLVAALDAKPLKISYSHLVGTGRSERATAPCNAIIQAAVEGQGSKQYTDNWTADGYIRWAHCLGFIKYEYVDDTFIITESGLSLSEAYCDDKHLSVEEHRLLVDAMLSYPPAIRVLSLLAEENAHLTKFEIGKQLGFTGESGFTSMPQAVFIRSLSGIIENGERIKMRNNWEGSSDKYARMIAAWLIKLGLVSKESKSITVTVGDKSYTENVGQAFVITAQGMTALRRAKGASRHKRISKTICYEMLATKGADREFLRTRRSLIIKLLSESIGMVASDILIAYLEGHNIITSKKVINDDVQGFLNIGIDIDIDGENYIWRDKINDFVIPVRAEIYQSSLEQTKDDLREKLTHISHDYLSLVDLAYDSTQNRLFEMKTLALLTEECGYGGLHLGGSRKPDGIIFTETLNDNYGVIIDTKAYSKGYNLPTSQVDEMIRYIRENQRRIEHENPNKWWELFRYDVQRFYFMFVSGNFIGGYQERIGYIISTTETKGTVLEICELLLIANEIKRGTYSVADVEGYIFR